MKLLIATHNQGKIGELSALVSEQGVDCVSLADVAVTFEVDETATSFIGNATLKAQQYAQATGLLTLADDSGLEIDALDGAPGVYTSRYGGAELSQTERMQLVLAQLADVDGTARAARFRCAIVLADPDGTVLAQAEGVCEGQIATALRGDGGFGYDPIFYLPEREATMAELPPEVKKQISHRGRAVRNIVPAILAQAA